MRLEDRILRPDQRRYHDRLFCIPDRVSPLSQAPVVVRRVLVQLSCAYPWADLWHRLGASRIRLNASPTPHNTSPQSLGVVGHRLLNLTSPPLPCLGHRQAFVVTSPPSLTTTTASKPLKSALQQAP